MRANKFVKPWVFMVSIFVVSIVLTLLAYMINYEGVLTKPTGIAQILLFILLINIMGNLVQIVCELWALFRHREEKIREELRAIKSGNEALLNLIKLQNSENKALGKEKMSIERAGEVPIDLME